MIKRPVILAGFAFNFLFFLLMIFIIRQEKELIAAQYVITTLLLWLAIAVKGDRQ